MKQNISIKDYILFFEAWCLLALARFITYTLPFRMIAKMLKRNHPHKYNNPNCNAIILEEISKAISRACNHSFWRVKCFEQALAGKMILNHRHIRSSVYFGVSNNGKFVAHAWLECDGKIITGEKGKEQFTVINKFQ